MSAEDHGWYVLFTITKALKRKKRGGRLEETDCLSYVPACMCGWTGPPQLDERQAAILALQHKRGQG